MSGRPHARNDGRNAWLLAHWKLEPIPHIDISAVAGVFLHHSCVVQVNRTAPSGMSIVGGQLRWGWSRRRANNGAEFDLRERVPCRRGLATAGRHGEQPLVQQLGG